MFKKLRQRAARKALTAFKGKLTYAGVFMFALPLVGQYFGVAMAEHEVAEVAQAVGVLIAWFGRWRAIRTVVSP